MAGIVLTVLDCRYFCGLSATPNQQKTLIEEFFNACFTKNKAAAREGKHAVTFTECQELAKRVLAANKVIQNIDLLIVFLTLLLRRLHPSQSSSLTILTSGRPGTSSRRRTSG